MQSCIMTYSKREKETDFCYVTPTQPWKSHIRAKTIIQSQVNQKRKLPGSTGSTQNSVQLSLRRPGDFATG